jgi:hypothetical protein
MVESKVWEFDVTVTVRKRVHLSGPTTREGALDILEQVLPSMGFGPFAKRGETGHPIETILSNEFIIDDVL